MGTSPAGPARFLRIRHLFVLLIPALVVLIAVTGFVWAHKGVTVVVDGESRYLKTQADDVAALLAQAEVELSSGDVVSPSPDETVADGMTIVVRHAVPVVVELSGESMSLEVVGTTVADALVAAGADPQETLVVDPPLDSPLVSNMTISASNVFVRVVEEQATIPFEVVTRFDSSAGQGSRTVVQKGVPGAALRVYRVVVTDGVEGARELISETVMSPPVDEIVAVGTKRTGGHVARGSSPTPAPAPAPAPSGAQGKQLTVTSTAYSPAQPGLSTRTATGAKARFGVIAVDPRVIPMGTRVYVPGYGYAVAADTGGAIKGNKIDVCFDSVAECMAWGRRSVTITILP